MRRRTSQGSEPREPRAPALEAPRTAASQASPVLHWLYLTFLLLGVVLWTSIPAFAEDTPLVAAPEAHAARGEPPEHCPGRPEGGERGEVEVIEDERDPESDAERDPLTSVALAELSASSIVADRIRTMGRLDRQQASPLTGAGAIRGPPGDARA